MRRLRLEQGSPDWRLWRDAGIGASDAPAIMNASPWVTAERLWRQKVGLERPQAPNYAMRRGLRLEDEARRRYVERTGVEVRPACVVHDTLDWLRASLDGLDLWETVAAEIKCPNAEDHADALRGDVPRKYVWQLVHQALVTGLHSIDYVSYNPESYLPGKDDFALVPYVPLADELSLYMDAAEEFMRCIRERVSPSERKATVS